MSSESMDDAPSLPFELSDEFESSSNSSSMQFESSDRPELDSSKKTQSYATVVGEPRMISIDVRHASAPVAVAYLVYWPPIVFNRFIAFNTGTALRFILYLGHRGKHCSMNTSTSELIVGDLNGFHALSVCYCTHLHAETKSLQLFAFGIFPCSDIHPRSGFTTALLDTFNIFSTVGLSMSCGIKAGIPLPACGNRAPRSLPALALAPARGNAGIPGNPANARGIAGICGQSGN
ncbi:hypothetical protein BDV93DRAFT_513529 [Ceratobasidium sp. AG-I]|nr:hypothetical protein BDV93DRAFT_513529 [Ceratobasidium sp. AG-I]